MALTGITDLDLEILMNLPDRDLLNYCSTNKDIYNMCNNDHFWRKRFIKGFGETVAQYKPKEKKWKNHYMQVVIDLDMFSKNPWEFVKYIQWSPKGAEFSKFVGQLPVKDFLQRPSKSLEPIPFLEAPEWFMNNFYLLEIPNFKYKDMKYSKITPAKLFEIMSKDKNPDHFVNGFMTYLNKNFYSY